MARDFERRVRRVDKVRRREGRRRMVVYRVENWGFAQRVRMDEAEC